LKKLFPARDFFVEILTGILIKRKVPESLNTPFTGSSVKVVFIAGFKIQALF
jgi:hypothetical protein